MKGRRGLTRAVLLCLLGASVVLVAAGRDWAVVEVAAGPISEAATVAHPGTDLVPGVTALGLLGLAGVVALAATRRTGRTLVGLVLLATGVGVLFAVVGALGIMAAEELPGQTGADTVDLTAWPAVTAVGGLLLLAAGLLTVVGGRSWPALGQRYDAPAAAAAPTGRPEPLTEKGLWEALDRGEDPTANLGTLAGPPADREADRT